jgi:arabinose-5-phosphate isomerase
VNRSELAVAFREVLEAEGEAILCAARASGEEIVPALERLHGCAGRVVVTGVGKCGHVGRKIAATLASTGTPAAFVHPAEALHGDLGFFGPGDVALVLSNSGETGEVAALLPHLRRMGIPVVAMTGRPDSTLARRADHVILTTVGCEADPLDTAPTASTTLMLATGDAIACVLMRWRGFTKADYSRYHPGGALGARLLCTVGELMHTGEAIPAVPETATFREALMEVTSKRLGLTLVTDAAGVLSGILTDGDIRRVFQREVAPLDLPMVLVMTRNPKTAAADLLAVEALRHMEDNLITALAVTGADGRPEGVIHIHDLLRAGL